MKEAEEKAVSIASKKAVKLSLQDLHKLPSLGRYRSFPCMHSNVHIMHLLCM